MINYEIRVKNKFWEWILEKFVIREKLELKVSLFFCFEVNNQVKLRSYILEIIFGI